MGRLLYSGMVSPDGYVADKDGNVDWHRFDSRVVHLRYRPGLQPGR